MSSNVHALPEPTGETWPDPVTVSGTFARVPALVPWASPSTSLSMPAVCASVMRWAEDGTPAGVTPQREADIMAEVCAYLDQPRFQVRWLSWPWLPVSGRCAYQTDVPWPDGSSAVLICSLDPGHEGLHVSLDPAGNPMPLAVDDAADTEELVA